MKNNLISDLQELYIENIKPPTLRELTQKHSIDLSQIRENSLEDMGIFPPYAEDLGYEP